MTKITTKIVRYLNENGAMSSRDICDDLGVDEFDLDFALYYDRAITYAEPPHGASSFPWYEKKISG